MTVARSTRRRRRRAALLRADNATGFRNVRQLSVVGEQVQIVIDGQSRHLGQFATAEEERWRTFPGPG